MSLFIKWDSGFTSKRYNSDNDHVSDMDTVTFLTLKKIRFSEFLFIVFFLTRHNIDKICLLVFVTHFSTKS